MKWTGSDRALVEHQGNQDLVGFFEKCYAMATEYEGILDYSAGLASVIDTTLGRNVYKSNFKQRFEFTFGYKPDAMSAELRLAFSSNHLDDILGDPLATSGAAVAYHNDNNSHFDSPSDPGSCKSDETVMPSYYSKHRSDTGSHAVLFSDADSCKTDQATIENPGGTTTNSAASYAGAPETGYRIAGNFLPRHHQYRS